MSTPLFLLMIATSLFHVLWNFVVKQNVKNPIVIIWSVFVGATTYSILLLFIKLPFQVSYIHVISSGFFHSIYFIMLIRIYKNIEFSQIYPLTRGLILSFIWIFDIYFQRTEPTLHGLLAFLLIAMALFGLAFYHKQKNQIPLSVKQILIFCLISATCNIIDSFGIQHSQPLSYISILWITAALFLFFYHIKDLMKGNLNVTKKMVLPVLIIGLSAPLTYCIILFVMKSSPASVVFSIREVAIPFSVLFGILFFKEEIKKRKLLYISMIFIGVLLLKF